MYLSVLEELAKEIMADVRATCESCAIENDLLGYDNDSEYCEGCELVVAIDRTPCSTP